MALKSLGRFSEEVLSGVHPDVEDDKKILWADGENVIFTDKGVRPIRGQQIVAPKLQSHPGSGLLEIVQGGKKTLFWGTPKIGTVGGKLFRWQEDDLTIEDVTRTSGGDYNGTGLWSLARWGTFVVATNGLDEPQIYGHPDDVNDFVDFYSATGVTGLIAADTFEIFHGTTAFMFGFATDQNGSAFRWSDEDDVQEWLPAIANSAGDLPIRNLFSDIKAAVEFPNGIGVYGENQLHLVEFIGGALVQSVRGPVVEGIGAWGKHSVTRQGAFHYGCGRNGFFKTDGFQFQYIDTDKVHDYWNGRVDKAQASKSIAWSSPDLFNIFFSYPVVAGSGENEETLAYNFLADAWSPPLDFGRSAATNGSIFENPFFVTTGGDLASESEGVVTQPEGVPLKLAAVIIGTDDGYGLYGYGEGMGYGGINTGVG